MVGSLKQTVLKAQTGRYRQRQHEHESRHWLDPLQLKKPTEHLDDCTGEALERVYGTLRSGVTSEETGRLIYEF